MEQLLYLIWLHLKEKVLLKHALRLLSYFGSAEAIYHADESMYRKCGITNENTLLDLTNKNLKPAEREIKKASKLGITIIGIGTELYPTILNELPDPPLVLYVQGDVSVLHQRNAFCIVGTRKCTAYGMSAALGVSEQLARCGMVIVSGVALGIDSGAHRGAIRGQGKTIGIMGCGLDVPYPYGNEQLKNDIIKNGALISEFPLGTQPLPSNFPIRNRLLSGFSLGVAVMEAGERSGSLITAKYAAEQGRDVFALPGNISNPMSAGTNRLIQDGAALLSGADAILAEYLIRFPAFFNIQEMVQEDEKEDLISKTDGENLMTFSPNDKEKKLLKVLNRKPMHINEIVRLSEMTVSEVMTIITMLHIKGKIKSHPGEQYSL